PVALALRCPAAILRDHVTGECLLLTEQGRAMMLDTLEADVANARGQPPLPAWTPPATLEEDLPERYIQGVRSILDYLAAGDVFQANLSRAWRAMFDAPPGPAALFQRLRENNPAPFAGLFAGEV